jgi:2-oxo-4-hydroxy-4-carboxy-5-ureidoimidazoline decarboxylase
VVIDIALYWNPVQKSLPEGGRMPVTFSDVNTLDREPFVALLGPLFEQSPWVAAAAWPARPFASLTHLHDTLCSVMYAAPLDQQVALIRAHPDLVGRAALAGTLTPESSNEQAAAGLDRLSPEEIAAFTALNAAYHARFGFPFVICVRENRKAGILAGFNARLDHTRDEEIATALGEIAKISYLRLMDRVRDDTNREG